MLNKLTIVIIYFYENFTKFYVHKERILKDTKLKIKFMEGGPMILPTDPPIALCRCGYSENKPYCDGQHAEPHGYNDSVYLPDFTVFIPLATIRTNGGD